VAFVIQARVIEPVRDLLDDRRVIGAEIAE
jgi:hypothetical protein